MKLFCFSTEWVFISECSQLREEKQSKLLYLLALQVRCIVTSFAGTWEGCVQVTDQVIKSAPRCCSGHLGSHVMQGSEKGDYFQESSRRILVTYLDFI